MQPGNSSCFTERSCLHPWRWANLNTHTHRQMWTVTHTCPARKERKSLGSCFYKNLHKSLRRNNCLILPHHAVWDKQNEHHGCVDSSMQFINMWVWVDVSLHSCSSFILRLLFWNLTPDSDCAVCCVTFCLLPPSYSFKSINKNHYSSQNEYLS